MRQLLKKQAATHDVLQDTLVAVEASSKSKHNMYIMTLQTSLSLSGFVGESIPIATPTIFG